MSYSDKLIYSLLFFVSLSLIGMLTASWRLILYSYLFVIGLAILTGILKSVKENPRKIWIPITVSIAYFMLYGWLDIMTIDSPTGGSSFIFGLTPSLALYVLCIWPLANLICLLYAWTFTNEKSITD
ncbi:hypothetical protein MKY41_18775 [Sporosarcina sp. FSL W7-1349]|uniref:hypothetical protein n=1 Tax=Sporosarcina sp. FSL W7-1349 TaxID=2921561 RepID=UPI0030F645B1